MESLDLIMKGLVLFQPKVYPDNRGHFLESFNEREMVRLGIRRPFKVECQSVSKQGTLRGLHAQRKNSQAKLVRVVHGEVYDVQVDIRPESSSYMKWAGVRLSDENNLQIYIPEGFLHGFLVLSESATVVYKTTDYYSPEDELNVRWDDPDIGIVWPIRPTKFSLKDFNAKTLREQV